MQAGLPASSPWPRAGHPYVGVLERDVVIDMSAGHQRRTAASEGAVGPLPFYPSPRFPIKAIDLPQHVGAPGIPSAPREPAGAGVEGLSQRRATASRPSAAPPSTTRALAHLVTCPPRPGRLEPHSSLGQATCASAVWRGSWPSAGRYARGTGGRYPSALCGRTWLHKELGAFYTNASDVQGGDADEIAPWRGGAHGASLPIGCVSQPAGKQGSRARSCP